MVFYMNPLSRTKAETATLQFLCWCTWFVRSPAELPGSSPGASQSFSTPNSHTSTYVVPNPCDSLS